MALTPEEQQRLAEIDSELSKRSQEESSSGLTPEEQLRLDELNTELDRRNLEEAETKRSFLDKSLDKISGSLSDIYHSPKAFAKGAARLADIVSYPVRKGLEAVVGRDINTLESSLPSYSPKTTAGRLLHKGSEYAGEMIGGGGVGKGLILAGEKLALPYATKALTKTGQFLGSPTSAKELATLGALGGASGVASQSLQEAGVNPIVADLTGGIGFSRYATRQALKNAGVHEKPKLSGYEKNILKEMKKILPPEEYEAALQRLSNYQAPLEGYLPSTAEVTKNTGLSQAHRAYEGHHSQLANVEEAGSEILNKHISDISPQHGDVSDITSLTRKHVSQKEAKKRKLEQDLIEAKEGARNLVKTEKSSGSKFGLEETGNKVRTAVENKLEALKRLRTRKSEPLYESLEQISDKSTPSHTYDYIQETIENLGAKSPIKGELLSLKKELKPNTINHEKESILRQIDESSYTEEVKKKLREQVGVEELNALTPNELNNVKKALDRKITTAAKTRDFEKVHYLQEARKNLIKDLEYFPEAAKANQTYREHSLPINEIENARSLKKTVAKDIYKQDYTHGSAELPHLFTNSTNSIKNAKDFTKVFSKDKKTMDSLKEFAYQDFLDKAVNSSGHITTASVNAWLKTHPGARIIDPTFQQRLSKFSSAEKFADSISFKLKKAKGERHSQVFRDIMGVEGKGIDNERIIETILSGKNRTSKVDDLLQLFETDKSGSALKGFQKGIVDHLFNKTSLAATTKEGAHNISYPKFKEFMRTNGKILGKVFTPEQVKTLQAIEGILKNRNLVANLGKAKGSPTSSNIHMLQELGSGIADKNTRKFLSSFGIKGDIVGGVIDLVKNGVNTKKQSNIVNFLSDPQYAKELLKKGKLIDKREGIKKSIQSPARNMAILRSIEGRLNR